MSVYCPFADKSCIVDAPLHRRYLVSIYYVMTTMSSVGYGDVLPRSTAGEWL